MPSTELLRVRSQIKTYKYRIYPNKAVAEKLQWTLDRCRELYNAALDERTSAYRVTRKVHIDFCGDVAIVDYTKSTGKSIRYNEQQNDLPEIKEIRPEYKEIGSHVLQNVLRRVDLAMAGFFDRVKKGQTPGYPRFQGKGRYDSFTYPDIAGWKFIPSEKKHAKLILSKIGEINVKMHRPVEGTIKTTTVKREGEHWYVVFTSEVKLKALEVSYEDVGIDLGITHFSALSNGEMVDNPRYYRRAEKKLKKLQESLSRKKHKNAKTECKGHRRRKASKAVAKAHRKIRNQRKDFHHKESKKLVNRYQVIVFEDLQAANLSKRPKPKQDEEGNYLPNGAAAKGGLNKSIQDAGWYSFTEMVKAKAENAGRTVIFVNPRNTSQICSACHKKGHHKDLSERTHICIHCGIVLDRDTNAAINILELGYKLLQAGTQPTQVIA
jgi:putative transposase